MQDADADVEVDNRLPLVVLVAVSGIAIYTTATSYHEADDGATSQRYPVVVTLAPPSVGDRPALKLSGDESRSTGSTAAEVSRLGEFPDQVEATTQKERARPDHESQSLAVAGAQPAKGYGSTTPFLVSDFNLGSTATGKNAIDVEKPVLIDGRGAGKIHLRIDATARVYVRKDDVAKLIGSKAALAQWSDQDFIPLDKVRDLGLIVRYSASQDELLVTT